MSQQNQTCSQEKSAPFLGSRVIKFESLEELRDAVNAFETISRQQGTSPDAVLFSDLFALEMYGRKLTDGSVVYDLRVRVATEEDK